MPMQAFLEKIKRDFPGISISHQESGGDWLLETSPENFPQLAEAIHRRLGTPLAAMFATDERTVNGCFGVYCIFAVRDQGHWLTLKLAINPEFRKFPALAPRIPAANLYEREIHDLFGLTPEGHPDLRRWVLHANWPEGVYPLCKDTDGSIKPPMAHTPIQFTKVRGGGVYEIPVGPVHAGIIEPGHFRFSVAGEPIINLEAQLYYVHKGLEKLAEGMTFERGFYLAERISGDETYANSLAYCRAIENIAGVTVPLRAEYSRVILAELERLVAHLGDLAGVCVDVAYGFAAFQFRLLRGWTYQIIEETCGSRFMRSVNRLGGLRRDFIAGNEAKIREFMARIRKELTETEKIIKANSMFVDRVEHTGILKHDVAVDLNAVGPAGRAAGIRTDLRKEFPYAAYGRLIFDIPDHQNGDVNCRVNVKLEECFTAIDLVLQALDGMPSGPVITELPPVEPYRFGLGFSEAPRGENLHWIMTGENNTIFRYKIRTPSFCNWPALCLAVKGNIVPDFPLINKSFNLSYAGNDL